MRTFAKVRVVSVLLAGVVLAADPSGRLVCIGDGTAPHCCRDSEDARQARPAEAEQTLAGAECECCITVDAIPSIAGGTSYKASLDVVVGPAHLRNVVLPSGTPLPRAASGDGGDPRLSSLRTIVLLV